MTESEWHVWLVEELKKLGVVTIGTAGLAHRVHARVMEIRHDTFVLAYNEGHNNGMQDGYDAALTKGEQW